MKFRSSNTAHREKTNATVWHGLTQLILPGDKLFQINLLCGLDFPKSWPLDVIQDTSAAPVMAGSWRTYTTSTHNRANLKGRTEEERIRDWDDWWKTGNMLEENHWNSLHSPFQKCCIWLFRSEGIWKESATPLAHLWSSSGNTDCEPR